MKLETIKDLQELMKHHDKTKYLDKLSDNQWQKIFKAIKHNVEPTGYKRLPSIKSNPSILNRNWWLSDSTKQDTQYSQYRRYINDVLNEIRIGRKDYCYHMYQVAELLRFHPDRLRTKLVDGYIEVWLDR